MSVNEIRETGKAEVWINHYGFFSNWMDRFGSENQCISFGKSIPIFTLESYSVKFKATLSRSAQGHPNFPVGCRADLQVCLVQREPNEVREGPCQPPSPCSCPAPLKTGSTFSAEVPSPCLRQPGRTINHVSEGWVMLEP